MLPHSRPTDQMPRSKAPGKISRSRSIDEPAVACVLHGGWLPAVSGGSLLIWGESAQALHRPRKDEHPFQLRRDELVGALREAGAALADDPEGRPGRVHRAWAGLPGNGTRPAPSLELQADVEDQGTGPAAHLGAWRIDTVEITRLPDLLSLFNSGSAHSVRSIRCGHDLRFWQRLAERLLWSVRRHEYLPSIVPVSPGTERRPKRRRTKAADSRVGFESSWELAEFAEDGIVAAFSGAMASVCGALWTDDPRKAESGIHVHDSAELVRHFLAVQLDRTVRAARFPVTAVNRLEGTFVRDALATPSASFRDGSASHIGTQTWEQWRRWRDRIQRSARDADERICFRLEDANPASPDAWRLEWLLSSRRDPSLLVPLAAFWSNRTSDRPPPRVVREVLLQLGQAARLYDRLWDGMDSDAPSEIILDRGEALAFLRRQAPILQGAGFRVIVPAWWTVTGQRRLRLRLAARRPAQADGAGNEGSGLLGLDQLVQYEPRIVLDGKVLTKEEWERITAAKEGLVQVRGQWMELREGEVSRLEEYWDTAGSPREMTFGELIRAEAGTGPDSVEVACDGELGGMLSVLRGAGGLKMLAQPARFEGQLREYQVRGFSWLAYLEQLGLGACLADDMGLGKTIQVIATVLEDKNLNPDAGPTLLVAPTSVLGNWQRETRRFAPTLSTFIHHGPQRAKTAKALTAATQRADIVIVSFGVARSDAAVLRAMDWRRLVVDESQNIKNPSAAVTKAVRGIGANRRIALTGTPVENRLMDLWSLFSMLNPGFLGSMTDFRKNVERPIMQGRDRAAVAQLRGMVRPFILRRMKTDKAIIKDLPAKVEQNSFCNLTTEQATLYEAVVRDLEAKLEAESGIERQGLMFATLMRLKQICNHPAQYLQDASEFSESRSHKLARVCEMLDEIEAEGESALVFTQFAEVGKSLEALFRRRYGGAVYYLHGATPRARREHMVAEFQDPDSDRAIFVLSLRAGGTGITLTRANHVIHFDRWWNPAVENQATDRAFRIGQDKTVFVHKMVTMGTLEERIDELIESKKSLAEEIIATDESWLADLDNQAFRALIALDRRDALLG